MTREVSLYLDLVRFLCALVVFLGHAAGKLTDGFLWQLNSYLSAAVMIFFVLSGYVIAYVIDKKEGTLKDYAIARVSRLSSVAIPALLLTALLDFAGSTINHELYYGGPWPAPQPFVLNYVLSALFVQNIWGLDLNPGINVPFWSLSFEVGFYAIFAAFFFCKGKKKIFLTLGLCLFFGPNIVTYLPIWLMGLSLYFLHKKIQNVKMPIALLLFGASALLLFWLPHTFKHTDNVAPFFYIGSRHVLADYAYAIAFSIHLFACAYLSGLLKLLSPFRKQILFLSSCTFSMYLFHRPLIHFFASLELGPPGSLTNRVLVLVGTVAVIYTLGLWSEKKKHAIRHFLLSTFNR